MRKPVVVKLVTGEHLFTEVKKDEASQALSLYQPYRVGITDNNLLLAPWVPFTDDEIFIIPISKVVSISNLDSEHKKMYGSVLMGLEISKHKSKLDKSIIYKPDVKDIIEKVFDDILYTVADIGLSYGIQIPEYEDLKSTYYSFVFNLMGSNNVALRQ